MWVLGRISLVVIVIFLVSMLSGFTIEKHVFYFVICSILVYFIYIIRSLVREKYRLLSLLIILSFFISYAIVLEFLFNSEVVFLNARTGIQSFNGHYNKLVSFTSIFSTGLVGLSLGLRMGRKYDFVKLLSKSTFTLKKVMTPFIYFSLCIIIIVLKYIISPKEFIFSIGYTDLRTTGLDIQVRGLGSLHYFLSLLFIPMYLDYKNSKIFQKQKKTVFYITLFIYLVIFEFFKGERTSVGILVCFVILNVYFNRETGRRLKKVLQRNYFKLVLIGGIGFFGLFFLGFVRDGDDYSENVNNFSKALEVVYKKGTWMGASYSTIGVNDDHMLGKDLLYGKTYLMYAQSIVPKILLTPFGIDRPLDDEKNDPGFWYDEVYTQGGLSLVVVPMRNFGFFGVFVILFLIGRFIKYIEFSFFTKDKLLIFIIYCSIITFALRWVWYGEIYLIRAIMMGWFIYLTHGIILKFIR